MIVRRLQPGDDLQPAIALLQRFFREEGFDTADQVIAANARKMVEIAACGLFVAEAAGEAVGVASISMEFGIEYGWSAEMGDIYVVPEWRGRGVSRRLIAEIEAFLSEKGASGYQVTVTPHARHQHDLASYYANLGFADEGRMILYRLLKKR